MKLRTRAFEAVFFFAVFLIIKTCLSRIAPETGWRWPYAPGTGSARGRGYTAFLRCVNRQATRSLGTIAC